MANEVEINMLDEFSMDPAADENVDSTESAPTSESNLVSESGYGTDKGLTKRELSSSHIVLSDATFQIFLSNFLKYHNSVSFQREVLTSVNNNDMYVNRQNMRRKFAMIVLICLVLAFILSCVLILTLTRTKIRHVGNLRKQNRTSIWSGIDPRHLFFKDSDFTIKKPVEDMTLGQFVKIHTDLNNTMRKNTSWKYDH
ncbi:uncharacterized protein LOC134237864 isoform X1 [Saccostrea cucullata]|uniref:uncharacterized protein LOC134237864 isoform X1 n=1 Tax=Saccostrea cuccullata TaxID=36930 RepID=UPI002ED69240